MYNDQYVTGTIQMHKTLDSNIVNNNYMYTNTFSSGTLSFFENKKRLIE